VVVDGRVMAFQDEIPDSHQSAASDEDEPPTRGQAGACPRFVVLSGFRVICGPTSGGSADHCE
ncbi:hypothetical protein, partial [Kitasatospora sp. NPDC001175]|uniref:hypothetical protein n=1 Tax=Kitasatospora sp. NPDC001175 TaxID=3157103 RepID=UPI003CFF08EB